MEEVANQFFNRLSKLDNIESKNSVPISLSGGGTRSYCSCLGVMRSLLKNNLIKDIPYISAVSGASWLTMILSHSELPLEKLLLFDINTKNYDDNHNILVDIVNKMHPESDLLKYFFKSSIVVTNDIINNFILQNFDLDNKLYSRSNDGTSKIRQEWPTYIISSAYHLHHKYFPIEYTPDYTVIGGYKPMFIDDKTKIKQNNLPLTITNVVASSSYIINIIPSLLSYDLYFDGNDYKVNDGAYLDSLAITPLLRRQCKKIFSIGSHQLNEEGKLKIQIHGYEDFIEGWHEILDEVDKLVKSEKLCYIRKTVNIKNNSQYDISAYQAEILFYFVSDVKEFRDTIPALISNSPEMKNFPTFKMIFENERHIIALSKIQSYNLITLSEWACNRIISLENDFFI